MGRRLPGYPGELSPLIKPVDAWRKSAHWAGFSWLGSNFAKESRFEGMVVGGETMTSAISSPFRSTMSGRGSLMRWPSTQPLTGVPGRQ